MAKRDFYEVLGVARNATADEIKRAYRKLAMKHHPDRAKGDKVQAAAMFNEVQEAYDVLSDEQKRRNYDQFGHAGVGAGGQPPPGGDPWEQFRRAQQGRGGGQTRTWQSGPGVSVEDFDVGGEGISDIFEQLFGRGGGRGANRKQQREQPQRGADVEHPVTLTFEQAARGTTLPLQINRDGKLETIDIKIPPGVNDGSRVRIKGRGQYTNGEPGDLYILTHVRPHEHFRREGLDIYVDLPVSLWEALNGAKVEVPTLDGPVHLTIPPGAPSGSKLRIKGKGVQRGTEQGDQFAVTKIFLPKHLSDHDKQLLKEIEARHPLDMQNDRKW